MRKRKKRKTLFSITGIQLIIIELFAKDSRNLIKIGLQCCPRRVRKVRAKVIEKMINQLENI